jgi:predicted dehydrogenase
MTDRMTAQNVAYLPIDPRRYSPGIALIGCGFISAMHLAAYRDAGYRVLALCDLHQENATRRQKEFFPGAAVTTDYRQLLQREDIGIVDVATQVEGRHAIVRAALEAGKHVLSQKPFVRDLPLGDELAALADRQERVLAVNQNGRWAQHFSYLLHAAHGGLIGNVTSADFAVYWPHDLDVEHHAVFATMPDLILWDFGIHWFDIIAQVFKDAGPATSVYAHLGVRRGQVIAVPTWAQVLIEFDNAAATLVLRGSSRFRAQGRYRVDGDEGAILHDGAALGGDTVEVHSSQGVTTVDLEGSWWTNGMHGTMAELMCAIEEKRAPSNSARASLPGLALCFAALQSARSHQPVDPRTVIRPPDPAG